MMWNLLNPLVLRCSGNIYDQTTLLFLKRAKGSVLCMSGKKHQPQPKVWIGQLVRVLHRKPGGTTYGAQNIILMMGMEEKLTPINLKTWESQTISWCLEERVVGNKVHTGTPAPIRYRVCCQGKRKVAHWGLFPVGGNCEPWMIAPDVMLPSGYVGQCLLNKGGE